MKYPFFNRKGRPTQYEQGICKTINEMLSDKKISQAEIDEFISNYGVPQSTEELENFYSILTGEDADSQNSIQYEEDDIDIEDTTEIKNESNMTNNDNPSESGVNFNPFSEPVVEREYTKGAFQSQEEQLAEDDFGFTEEETQQPIDGIEDAQIEEEIEQDIPEPQFNNTQNPTNYGGEEEEGGELGEGEEDLGSEKLGGDNLQDLSPAQKRKSAEKTAEAILNMYCNFAPLPFKKWASFNPNHIQKLVFEKKIDMDMQVEQGVTIRDYINGVNEQVEDIFKVSQETRDEIKDPLIDVLMEQELALTPTQRLLIAVGGHVITMGFSAFQLSQNNKQALETFERFQQNASGKSQASNDNSERRTRPTPSATQSEPLSKMDRESVEELIRQMEGDNDDDDDDIMDGINDPNVSVDETYDEE